MPDVLLICFNNGVAQRFFYLFKSFLKNPDLLHGEQIVLLVIAGGQVREYRLHALRIC
jgi:hypothetical protein